MASEPPSPKSHQGKTSAEETNEKDDSRQQKGVGMMIDPMSPYYLHASDAPGQVYVAELLRDGNYGEWVNDMRDALFAKNKMSFVDGTLIMPTPDSPYLQQWMRCNAMVKGWLKSAMDKDIRGSVRFAITARDIWRDLEERFGKESAPRAFEIRRAVTLLRQDKATVSTYYTKLKSLWDEMNCTAPLPMCNCQGCKCNLSKKYAELREKEQHYDFLMGLDEEFNTVKSQILSTRPIPSLGVAYHMVSEDEQQRLISSTAKHGTEMTAFHVQSESSANPTVNMAGKLEHHETWVIGSGATDHIVNNPTLLSKIEEGLTLEEVDWNGKIADYDHLRVIGCLAYAHRHDNDKFQARSRPCIFVGYPGGQKGYKLYDITNQKFLVSRDVVFLEDIFPCRNQSFDLNHTSATHSQPGIIDDEYPTNFETCTTIQKEDITQIDVPSSPIVIEATHDQQPTASASPSSLETTSSTPTAVDIPAPRRSQRERRQPAHLADFQVDLPQSFDKSSKSPTSNMRSKLRSVPTCVRAAMAPKSAALSRPPILDS
nr:Integrase, catalytic core [Ipomoea batatas]